MLYFDRHVRRYERAPGAWLVSPIDTRVWIFDTYQ